MKVKESLSRSISAIWYRRASGWLEGPSQAREAVTNQYPLTQNYCMLPRAGSLEGREENHIEWKKSHLQIFLKLKIARILSAGDSLSCYAAVIMWAGCMLLHLKTKTECWKQELSGNSACLKCNGFSEFPDIISSMWLCLDGGTKLVISSVGSLKFEEEIIRNHKDAWHPAKTDDKSNYTWQWALQGEATQLRAWRNWALANSCQQELFIPSSSKKSDWQHWKWLKLEDDTGNFGLHNFAMTSLSIPGSQTGTDSTKLCSIYS